MTVDGLDNHPAGFEEGSRVVVLGILNLLSGEDAVADCHNEVYGRYWGGVVCDVVGDFKGDNEGFLGVDFGLAIFSKRHD